MIRIEKTFRFEASHILPKHDGKCARLHGHSWVGRVILESPRIQQMGRDSDGVITEGPKSGMLVDFGDVSSALKTLVENHLDHYHLNESTRLSNPTSENLARWIYWILKPALPLLAEVQIEETCTSKACYRDSSMDPEVFGRIKVDPDA